MVKRRARHLLPARFVGPNRRYIVRSRSSAVLLALAVFALAPSLGVAQYAPKWHVGDWWVVKTWAPSKCGLTNDWEWDFWFYEVARIDKVGKQDCYALEMRRQRRSAAGPVENVWYVRTDNWLVVRQVLSTGWINSVTADTFDSPLGLVGPVLGDEPRLPHFPLQLDDSDTAFKLVRRDECFADLREISSIADSTLVKSLLADGDSSDGNVVRPMGRVYQVRNEAAGNTLPGPVPNQREITQSLQLWSDDRPWRLFEELVDYRGPMRARLLKERSWLVAVGHKGK
jgi:hypothetical protein